jgi:hypothetical protein
VYDIDDFIYGIFLWLHFSYTCSFGAKVQWRCPTMMPKSDPNLDFYSKKMVISNEIWLA